MFWTIVNRKQNTTGMISGKEEENERHELRVLYGWRIVGKVWN